MHRRFEELDSLRGVAASIVLVSHVLFIFSTLEKDLKTTFPYLEFLWNGHSAVIIFFILSGFVLSLPFESNNRFDYSNYIIKRVCRIYIPYILVFFSTIAIKSTVQSKIGTVPNLQVWASWTKDVSLSKILDHIFFLGEIDTDAFLMVIWSLVHEMRISIIFPFVVFLLYKVGWKNSLGAALILSLGAYSLIKLFPTQYTLAISTNYFITFHYLSMFIVGAVLAGNREYFISKMRITKIKYPLILLSFICYNYPQIPFAVLGKLFSNMDYLLFQIITDWIVTIGAAGIIILALSSKILSKVLLAKPVRLTGKISYSLYLVHPVILISMVHVLYGKISIPFILSISLILTLIISWMCYKFIEVPSINLGRKITKVKEKRTVIVGERKAM